MELRRRFGSGIVATPLEAMELHPGGQGLSAQAQSLLDVDAPNVDLTVLKQSEQPGRGWIVRLVETAGHATDTTLHSGLLPIDRAWDASIAEDDRAPLPVREHRVHVHLLPYGMVTVRLMTATPRPGCRSESERTNRRKDKTELESRSGSQL